MLPWWRDPDFGPRYLDKRATEPQKGVWLVKSGATADTADTDGLVYGFLYGTACSELDQLDWSSCRFILLSYSHEFPNPSFVGSPFDQKTVQNPPSGYKEVFSFWSQDMKAIGFTRDERYWNVCNVLLVNRVGLCYERVAAGHISVRLWHTLSPCTKRIALV